MKFILGTKEEMTQVFDEAGKVYPVTVLRVGTNVVTQVKNSEKKDGYDSIQVGAGERNVKRITKSVKGHLKDLGNFRYIKEFRTKDSALNVGDKIDVSVFEKDDKVTVSSINKGKGFQGVVKRHGFHGGRRSHGQKHSEREAGSIGSAGIQRVFKGLRMAGRMGGDRITTRNLKVVDVDRENGVLLLKGAVPGRRGTLVEIKG